MKRQPKSALPINWGAKGKPPERFVLPADPISGERFDAPQPQRRAA